MPSYPAADRPELPTGYGLASASEGTLLDWSWATERLARSKSYWLATTRPDGRPHCMPVWAVWYEGALWLSTAAASRKARNLALRAECTLTTADAEEAVILEGRARGLGDDDPRFDLFADVYEEKYGFRLTRDFGAVYVVEPITAFGFIDSEDQFGQTATRWRFT